MARTRRPPETHPLIDALSQDGGAPIDAVVLSGFLGKGAEGRLRLYGSADLTSCIEFDADDLLHQTELAGSGAMGALVWIRRDAKVLEIARTTAESSFLQGGIVDEMLDGSESAPNEQARIIRTIVRTISRLFCKSRRGPCTVKSLCNTCPAG